MEQTRYSNKISLQIEMAFLCTLYCVWYHQIEKTRGSQKMSELNATLIQISCFFLFRKIEMTTLRDINYVLKIIMWIRNTVPYRLQLGVEQDDGVITVNWNEARFYTTQSDQGYSQVNFWFHPITLVFLITSYISHGFTYLQDVSLSAKFYHFQTNYWDFRSKLIRIYFTRFYIT